MSKYINSWLAAPALALMRAGSTLLVTPVNLFSLDLLELAKMTEILCYFNAKSGRGIRFSD